MSEAELCATRCQRPTEALVEKPCTGVFALSCNQLELSYKHVFVEVNYLGVSMQIHLSERGTDKDAITGSVFSYCYFTGIWERVSVAMPLPNTSASAAFCN